MINYQGGSICNILPSITNFYSIKPSDGIKRFNLDKKILDPFLMALRGSKKIVIFQIDALGFDLVKRIKSKINYFKNIYEIDSTFPTYTLPAFASFLTGTPPSKHGLVSGTFKIDKRIQWLGNISCTNKEYKKILLSESLLWDFDKRKKKVISILYDVNNSVYSTSLYPNPIFVSTKFVGNSQVEEAVTIENRVFEEIEKFRDSDNFIINAYFAYLDSISGTYGKFSQQSKDQVLYIFSKIEKIINIFPKNTLYIFMGDHGHMDLEQTVILEDEFLKKLDTLSESTVALDGRFAMVYSKKPSIARSLFKQYYGKSIKEISKYRFLDLLGGNCSSTVKSRVGNIIYLAKSGITVRYKPKVKKATHGGLLKEEVQTVFGFYKS